MIALLFLIASLLILLLIAIGIKYLFFVVDYATSRDYNNLEHRWPRRRDRITGAALYYGSIFSIFWIFAMMIAWVLFF